MIHGDFSKEILVDEIGDSAFVKYYHIYTNRCKYEAMLALAFGSIAITGKVNSDIHKNAKKLLKERARRKSSSSIEAIMLNDLENFPHVTECFFEL